MSSEVAIQAEKLGKCYHIYEKPRDRLLQMLARGRRRYFREFWALRDISFQMMQGQSMGVLGRNGSGKSTLLQLVCGTLNPTAGTIRTNGRVAALLELGSGFNSDFSGRENVFLNGAILGLERSQIEERFDAIAAFADIGDFLDQPLKTYSTGMTMRLAFAVIAHVDARILVIDEALAVGDAVFVQKCMRFIRRFRETGSVLFVSHNATAVSNLCEHALWLDQGIMRSIGAAVDVTKAYSRFCLKAVLNEQGRTVDAEAAVPEATGLPAPALVDSVTDCDSRASFFDNVGLSDALKTGAAEIVKVELEDTDGVAIQACVGGENIVLRITGRVHEEMSSPIIGFHIKDHLGQVLFGEHTFTYATPPPALYPNDAIEAVFRFRLPMLPNGDYSMTVSIADGQPGAANHVQHHWLHEAMLIRVFSDKLRYGLVGIPFESVTLRKH